MIEVHGMSKFYGQKKAVNNLDFSIAEGEIIGLLGLNGAGKSTILKILGCFLLPSNGEAKVGGYSVIDQAYEVRKSIGYLPDTPPLYNEMKVTSYLKFVGKLKGVAEEHIAASVREAMEKTNLDEVADNLIQELSHGYRQRVGIAQALVHKPKVLILDEPINGLDPIQIAEMRDLILSLKREHTVLLSSHILSEITKTCDRILVIDKGHLVAEGSEQELKSTFSGSMEICLALESISDAIIDKLQSLNAVESVSRISEIQGESIICRCQEDIRPEIAKTVIEEGGRLLSLKKQDAELESLFFKLIKSEESK